MKKTKQPTKLVVDGTTYKIRYFTQGEDGVVRAVLHIEWVKLFKETGQTVGPLKGGQGDEWPMVMSNGKCVGPEKGASFG